MRYELDGKLLDVKVVRKPNKNLYMRIENSHTILVTCNRFVSEKEIMRIIKKNEASIRKMYQHKIKQEEKNKMFYYLGKAYKRVYNENINKVAFDNDTIIAKNENALHKFYVQECFRVFENEMDRIIQYFENIPRFTLKIRTMKTRWGVNNLTKKTITLNSELLKKDLDLIDYVIIHELCHFYEPNHSPNFWNWVEKYYPKYKEARRRLRND